MPEQKAPRRRHHRPRIGDGARHPVERIAVTGDEAKAKTYAVLYRNATSKPEISGIIIYNDAFVRTADGWRLAVRYIDPVPAG